jgi:hypothetical protein
MAEEVRRGVAAASKETWTVSPSISSNLLSPAEAASSSRAGSRSAHTDMLQRGPVERHHPRRLLGGGAAQAAQLHRELRHCRAIELRATVRADMACLVVKLREDHRGHGPPRRLVGAAVVAAWRKHPIRASPWLDSGCWWYEEVEQVAVKLWLW